MSRKHTRRIPTNPEDIERGIRQLLADKVSGNLAGPWLLTAEHMRLGTWDLLCGWTGQPSERIEPRLAMQLVHEAAVCTKGIRADRTLHQRGGFELACGLPFIATDEDIHHLLNDHTIEDSKHLQIALGRLRKASGHFQGKLLAIDPHRTISHTKRRIRKRVENPRESRRAFKTAQTFWLLDADTNQPLCFATGTNARSVVDATPELIDMSEAILNPTKGQTLVMADTEHFARELLSDFSKRKGMDILMPIPNQKRFKKLYEEIPEEKFTKQWIGYATARTNFEFKRGPKGNYYQITERFGEQKQDYTYKGFVCTADRSELKMLTRDFPKRWHVEEFFNAHQALGWNYAGTLNLNIRYGKMTMALISQAAIHQLRERIGEPYNQWDATHLAKDLFHRLEGDVKVTRDTIVVTYYNAPSQLRRHYEELPGKLVDEGISPTIPWLYNYKLDFRFK